MAYAGVGRRNGAREPVDSMTELRLNVPIWETLSGGDGAMEPCVDDGGGD